MYKVKVHYKSSNVYDKIISTDEETIMEIDDRIMANYPIKYLEKIETEIIDEYAKIVCPYVNIDKMVYNFFNGKYIDKELIINHKIEFMKDEVKRMNDFNKDKKVDNFSKVYSPIQLI